MPSSQQALEAVVLSFTDVGEEDRIVTFLTRERGLLRAAASGARSLKKGRAASLDLFAVTMVDVRAPGRSRKLSRVRSSSVLEANLPIREDYRLLCAASYIAELLIRSAQENDPAEGVYSLMLYCLRALQGRVDPHRILLIFELRLLGEMGWVPELESCLICGKDVGAGAFFSPRDGGVVHGKCTTMNSLSVVSAGDLASLRFIAGKPLGSMGKLGLTDRKARELFYTVHSFTTHHLGFEPRTLATVRNLSSDRG